MKAATVNSPPKTQCCSKIQTAPSPKFLPHPSKLIPSHSLGVYWSVKGRVYPRISAQILIKTNPKNSSAVTFVSRIRAPKEHKNVSLWKKFKAVLSVEKCPRQVKKKLSDCLKKSAAAKNLCLLLCLTVASNHPKFRAVPLSSKILCVK